MKPPRCSAARCAVPAVWRWVRPDLWATPRPLCDQHAARIAALNTAAGRDPHADLRPLPKEPTYDHHRAAL